MRAGAIVCLISAGFMIALNGCASGRKAQEMEIQGLRNQVSVLEAQIQSKQQEIDELREELNKAAEDKAAKIKGVSKKKSIPEAKSRPKVKQIQIALSNAGYDPGAIDSRMGKQTKEAIKAFQRANNLEVDGRVGKKTWNLLKEYLDKKIK